MDERGPTTNVDPSGAEGDRSNVIRFPAHRLGTIEDTLSGFPGRQGHEGWFGTRAERRATVMFAEIRGWRTITERVGPVLAEQTLARVVSRCLEALSELGARDITLGGEPMQPVISCTFEGEHHAYDGLRAAAAVRTAAAKTQFPALPGHQYQVCIGVNSGAIVDASLDGEDGPLTFQSVGTIQMFAARLQEFAGPAQIFLSRETAEEVGSRARVRSIGEVRVNAAGERREAFILTGIVEAALPDPARWAQPEA